MARKRTALELYESFDQLPESAEIGVEVVALVKNVVPSTIWRWVSSGDFPLPARRGQRSTRWTVGQVRSRLTSEAA